MPEIEREGEKDIVGISDGVGEFLIVVDAGRFAVFVGGQPAGFLGLGEDDVHAKHFGAGEMNFVGYLGELAARPGEGADLGEAGVVDVEMNDSIGGGRREELAIAGTIVVKISFQGIEQAEAV